MDSERPTYVLKEPIVVSESRDLHTGKISLSVEVEEYVKDCDCPPEHCWPLKHHLVVLTHNPDAVEPGLSTAGLALKEEFDDSDPEYDETGDHVYQEDAA